MSADAFPTSNSRGVRVLVLDPLHPEALRQLDARYELTDRPGLNGDALRDALQEAEVVVLRSGPVLDRKLIDGARHLKVIARAGVGIDNIDVEAAASRGVTVFRVPSQSSRSVAEFCFGLILSAARHVALANAQVARGEWRKAELSGMELFGKTLGVVGVGRVGTLVLEMARGFSMRTLGCVRRHSEERALRLAQAGIELVELNDLLVRSDVVCLTLPLTPDSERLIGPDQFARMRAHALLVNVSRAGVVLEEDLVAALEAGHIGGVAVDVPASESGIIGLSRFDNAVVTPHIGAMTSDAQARIGSELLLRLEAALVGAEVPDRIC